MWVGPTVDRFPPVFDAQCVIVFAEVIINVIFVPVSQVTVFFCLKSYTFTYKVYLTAGLGSLQCS